MVCVHGVDLACGEVHRHYHHCHADGACLGRGIVLDGVLEGVLGCCGGVPGEEWMSLRGVVGDQFGQVLWKMHLLTRRLHSLDAFQVAFDGECSDEEAI